MATEVSLITAFVAGVLSITSPCVLPLIPLYLAHLTGVSVGGGSGANRLGMMLNAGAFVVGFSAVFVVVGAAIGAVGGLVDDGRVWLVRLGGLLLVLMGLHLLGLVRVPFLEREYRVAVGLRSSGVGRLASSLAVGAAFAAGWTPCVGPILGAILTMAAGTGDAQDAAVLLAAYAAGLGVPFLAAAAALGTAPRVIRRVQRSSARLETVSGALVLAAGVVLLLGISDQIFAELASRSPWRPWEPEL